jgi:hypothetical protein
MNPPSEGWRLRAPLTSQSDLLTEHHGVHDPSRQQGEQAAITRAPEKIEIMMRR